MMQTEPFHTIRVHFENEVGYLQIYRPDANNTINGLLISECTQVLDSWHDEAKIVVLEGLPEVFCFGADFKGMTEEKQIHDPHLLYQLWLTLFQGPFISIAKVQGQTNAGGMGFVSACDIVLADETAVFSLSELLFSLMPACVMPFLIQKIGGQRAHYMTLTTQPISALRAYEIGLVDALSSNVDELLRRHLLRLTRLSKVGITRYKNYRNSLNPSLEESEDKALFANKQVFEDKSNLEKISRYMNTGMFPWEDD